MTEEERYMEQQYLADCEMERQFDEAASVLRRNGFLVISQGELKTFLGEGFHLAYAPTERKDDNDDIPF